MQYFTLTCNFWGSTELEWTIVHTMLLDLGSYFLNSSEIRITCPHVTIFSTSSYEQYYCLILSQGLAPAHFTLITIVVVHVVKHQ